MKQLLTNSLKLNWYKLASVYHSDSKTKQNKNNMGIELLQKIYLILAQATFIQQYVTHWRGWGEPSFFYFFG